MTSYRILECAGCGQVVASFGDTRVLWPSGEPHRCDSGPNKWGCEIWTPDSVDDLNDITAQALAGWVGADALVADAVDELVRGVK